MFSPENVLTSQTSDLTRRNSDVVSLSPKWTLPASNLDSSSDDDEEEAMDQTGPPL